MNRNFLLSYKVFRIIAIVIIGIPLLASSQVNSNLPINSVEDNSFQMGAEFALADMESSVRLKGSTSENGDGGGGIVFVNSIIGMYSQTQKTWYLKSANSDGWENVSTVHFGSTDSSWIPLVGDWNGNGTDTIGMYSRTQKTWYLKGDNDDGWLNVTTVRFGSTDSSWIPVAGDWNGDGTDTVGMYSRTQKTWYLKDANVDGWGGVTTVRFGSVDSSWIPVVGDWNGNGTDTIGMYSRTQKTWYLKDTNNDGWSNVTTVRFGSVDSSWIPVVGDWNGNGTDTIGMYSRTQKTWYLKWYNADGWASINITTVRFGSTDSSFIPVVGDWDGHAYVTNDFVVDSMTLAPGEKNNKTVYCPSGSILVSGGYATFEDVLVFTQRWMDGGWRVYAKNNGSVSRVVNAYATCLHNVPAYTKLRWDYISVPATDNGRVEVTCPVGSVITGGGWGGKSDGSLKVYNSSGSSNGWEVEADNSMGSSQQLNAYAICLSGVGALSSETIAAVSISPGTTDGVSPGCTGGFVTGGGFYAQTDLVVYNTSPDTLGNQWYTYAKSHSMSSKILWGYAECLSFP